MSAINITFSEVQSALQTILEGYVPNVINELNDADWPTDGIPVYRGPLQIIPKVPSIVVSVPSINWEWGAVRCLDGTFNCNLLLSIENVDPEKRNQYLGIFEGYLRGQINAINHLQFPIHTEGVLRATIYDSLLTAGTVGEMAQGSYYSSRCSWYGKVWILQVGAR